MNNLERKNISINDKNIEFYIDYDNNDFYMSQYELSILFGTSVYNISAIISKVMKKRENANNIQTFNDLLNVESSLKIIPISKMEGNKQVRRKVKHYGFSIIKVVGYKLNIVLTDQLLALMKSLFDDYVKHNNANNSLYLANNCDIVRFNNGEIQLDVNVSIDGNTVWLNVNQLMILFNCSKSTLSYHINNILDSNELDNYSVVRIFRTTGNDKKDYNVSFYNLDMIISIGFRVNSKRGIEFRKWALNILKDYLLKGYAINDKRCIECKDNLLMLNNKVEELVKSDEELKNIVLGSNYQKLKEGEVVDSLLALKKIFMIAKDRIIIIDNYIDEFTIRIVEIYNVDIYIITGNSKIKDLSLKDNIHIIIDGSFHSRYILIDDKYTYTLTHSLNIIGRKDFEIIFIDLVKPKDILNKINIHL